MASPADHTGLVKWYNVRAGYGFIQDLSTGKDVFCHASGLTRSLKDRPPREGDEVLLAIREGKKGPEAKDVVPVGKRRDPTTSNHHISGRPQREEDLQARVLACIFTAEALAGSDHRRLQDLIPTILQFNGLPAIKIPLSALTVPNRPNRSCSRRVQPGTEAAPNIHPEATGKPAASLPAASTTPVQAAPAEAKPTGVRPGTWEETHENLDGKKEQGAAEEEEEGHGEEDEDVDILGSGSEREAGSPRPSTPDQRSAPQPPSSKQEEEDDEGWVTKEKRRRKSPDSQLVLPKDEQTHIPAVELRHSPTITQLRKEGRTGIVHDFVLNGLYIHEEDRFVGNIRGYNRRGAYTSHRYPKDNVVPGKKKS
ncbi:Cold shock-like protein CspE [Portunus trituberculatus]|uniref:Cold shock-like protein CspE n=1 Tax=Portunus trituberculatus TaxID=210409 RepID=A0A5B7I5L1_PORTR|nr:Cold shock-like protein CspE [Portunus trituberculatus]